MPLQTGLLPHYHASHDGKRGADCRRLPPVPLYFNQLQPSHKKDKGVLYDSLQMSHTKTEAILLKCGSSLPILSLYNRGGYHVP